MLDLDFCIQKLDASIELASSVADADFPHTDSGEALKELIKVYTADRERLRALTGAQPDTILAHCRRANMDIVRLKNFIGMLLRSANIRNAFEIYFPIKIYAQKIFGPDAKLILSSEWDFSPFVYPISVRELTNFIFIGVPASECQNPLVIPLAAHELGHVLWRRTAAKATFDAEIKRVLLDQYRANWADYERLFGALPVADIENNRRARGIWGQSQELAERQLEEIFCDYYGIHVFGLSFLSAFRYLISPSLGQYRASKYPGIRDRALYAKEAAQHWGMTPDVDFETSFSEETYPVGDSLKFVHEMADATTAALRIRLRDFLANHTGGIPRCVMNSPEEQFVKNSMLKLIPPPKVDSIASIVNAAWAIRLNVDGWNILGNIEDALDRRRQKIRVLRDLALKALELYEYNKRLSKNAA